jgi:hypothetical protein
VAHPASSLLGTGALCPGVKCLGHEADHPHLVLRLRMRRTIRILLHMSRGMAGPSYFTLLLAEK